MKILLANKFYYRRGGDCIYTLNLEQLLKANGHDVAVFAMDYGANVHSQWSTYFPSEVCFKPGIGMVEAFVRPMGSAEVCKKFSALLDEFKPNVLHLNNIHTQLSPVIAELAHKCGIKVVWTLHDYKLLCPRYDCLRQGKEVCEECFVNKCRVLQYKCMKNSALASVLGYLEAVKWNRERLESITDLFICPSQFMANKMIQGGFASHKMKVLCNFMDVSLCEKPEYGRGDYYCYVGRLSHEKGVATLIEAAAKLPYPLKIIGGGELMDTLKTSAPSHIEFVGYQQWPEIKEVVGHARFSVIPSEWYENNPLSVIEAECLGTPVLGANIGGIPELIDQDKTGMIFQSGNIEDLRNKIEMMYSHVWDHQQIALTSMQRYSADAYYGELMRVYQNE